MDHCQEHFERSVCDVLRSNVLQWSPFPFTDTANLARIIMGGIFSEGFLENYWGGGGGVSVRAIQTNNCSCLPSQFPGRSTSYNNGHNESIT
jgi:hypothetical protein